MKDLYGLGGRGRGRWCAEGDDEFCDDAEVDVEFESGGAEDGDGDEADEESFDETADKPAAAEVAIEEALDAAFDADSATIGFIVDPGGPADNEDNEDNEDDATVPAVDNGAAGGRYSSKSLSSLVRRDWRWSIILAIGVGRLNEDGEIEEGDCMIA